MIAILPPEPIYSEVQAFKKTFADTYQSKEALKRPAHITVVPPFEYSLTDESKLAHFMGRYLIKYSPFEVTLDGFGTFEKRVIFVQSKKDDTLKSFFKEFIKAFYKEFEVREGKNSSLPYSPHMTIGYKDLKPDMYDLAWQEFGSKLYRRVFMLDGLYLLRHSGKEWIVISEVHFSLEQISELTLGL